MIVRKRAYMRRGGKRYEEYPGITSVEFQLDMKIRMGFLLDLFHRTINIKEIYSEYKFNSQLEDSLSESG